ncbi:uncharacterized protein LOC134435730 [Engraulis encrasicolus]|uniref:uncharacterized protein LOC134435730 n=1 Tax=Engraulis encrasicolus TaxID=184585 RepID=UPI002FD57B94
MSVLSVAVFGALFCSVLSASAKAKEEHRIAFNGEDVHILVPSASSTKVVFRPRVKGQEEVVLMQNGEVNEKHTRARLQSQYLILEDVTEEDEGLYVIKNTDVPSHVRHITLIVRDCALEQSIKYADTAHIQLRKIPLPITVEFRYGISHINQTTESPPVVLLNQSSTPVEEYKGRLTVNHKEVTLHKMTGMDEGSYTILDSNGKAQMRTCLNVKEHQHFSHLEYDQTLEINLYLNHSKVSLVYVRDADHKERPILEQGELVVPMDPAIDGRLSLEGSKAYLKHVRVADMGHFRVRDHLGFHIADVHLKVHPYKLPQTTVVILGLLGLVGLMLLMCLLSCQIKVRRRNEKARKIALIAQQAGKADGGDAFRQVVNEAYTRFTEDSITQSQWDGPTTDNTEVEIKGLEVSKAGRYQSLASDKNFLEMSDSGVEFTSSGLPLDSDTEGPLTYASHKPLLDSAHDSDGFVTAPPTIAEGTESNASRTPDDSILSASPASLPRAGSQLDADLLGDATPDSPLRGPEILGDGGGVIAAPASPVASAAVPVIPAPITPISPIAPIAPIVPVAELVPTLSPAKEPSMDAGPVADAAAPAAPPAAVVENGTT